MNALHREVPKMNLSKCAMQGSTGYKILRNNLVLPDDERLVRGGDLQSYEVRAEVEYLNLEEDFNGRSEVLKFGAVALEEGDGSGDVYPLG